MYEVKIGHPSPVVEYAPEPHIALQLQGIFEKITET